MIIDEIDNDTFFFNIRSAGFPSKSPGVSKIVIGFAPSQDEWMLFSQQNQCLSAQEYGQHVPVL